MVPSAVPPPPWKTLEVLSELDGQLIPQPKVLLPELARSVKPAVEGDIEDAGRGRVSGPAGVPLKPSVEDHLSDELVGGVPMTGPEDRVNGPSQPSVGNVGAHVGVYVEVAAVTEEAEVELWWQLVDVHPLSAVAGGSGGRGKSPNQGMGLNNFRGRGDLPEAEEYEEPQGEEEGEQEDLIPTRRRLGLRVSEPLRTRRHGGGRPRGRR